MSSRRFGCRGWDHPRPLLVATGLDRHRSHATSLAAIVFIVVAGAISFGLSGEIDLAAGVAVGVGGVVGSVLGASLMNRLEPRTLTIIFAFVLLVAALRMITGADPLPASAELAGFAFNAVAFGIGLVAGFFAGLAGIGGGVVIVPGSVILLGLSQHEAQGTSLVAITFTAIAGTVVNFRNERVRLQDGLVVGMGGVVGSVIGSRLALASDDRTLSLIFGFLVLFVAIRSFYRLWTQRSVPAPESSS